MNDFSGAWQDASQPTDTADSVVAQFERVASACPSRTALILDSWQPTYAELNVKANRLAHLLLMRKRATASRDKTR